ncbi:MAG: tetratricopeptide repeat protein, partial [Myxococcota bacterium]
MDPNPEVDTFVERFEAEERRLRRRTAWLSLVPIVVSILVMVGTGLVLRGYVRQLVQARAEVASLHASQQALAEEVAALDSDLTGLHAERESIHQELQDLQRLVDYTRDLGGARAVSLVGEAGQAVKAGKLAEAARGLDDAIRIDPELAEAHYQLAYVRLGLGQQDEAVAAYRRAVAIDDSYRLRARRDLRFRELWDQLY